MNKAVHKNTGVEFAELGNSCKIYKDIQEPSGAIVLFPIQPPINIESCYHQPTFEPT